MVLCSIVSKFCRCGIVLFFLVGVFEVATAYSPSINTDDMVAKFDGSIVINQVGLQGNQRTKSYVILRELGFVSEDSVTWVQLEKARKRIENLNLFNRVSFCLRQQKKQQILSVNLTECWYIFPQPILYWNERDLKKLSYGGGVVHYNFRGRAELLSLCGWWGFNPGYFLQYVNRWFGGQHMFYNEVTFFSKRVNSQTLEFPDLEEKHRGFSLLFGKRWGFCTFGDVKLEYDVLRTDCSQVMLSKTEEDKLLKLRMHFKYDTRDLWEYPRRGQKAELAFSHCCLEDLTHPYRLLEIDWRYYQPVKALVLATRLAWKQSFGKLPVYDRLFLGYEERIRGHFQHISEGENRSVFSLETRFPLLNLRYSDLNTAISGSYLRNLRFGVYGSLFFDSGTTWFQNEKATLRNCDSGFGGGLNFLLPYSTVLRLEWAWDENLHSELIFDMNAAF